MRLTQDQQARIDRAREALAADTLTGPQEHSVTDAITRLASRTGQLEFWLGDMLALIDQLQD